MTRLINSAGLALIKEYEGLRLEAYDDGGGVWTIGWGHVRGVKGGNSISAERAEQLLEADLLITEHAVADLVKVPLTDNQFSALCCFVFNVGATQFAHSTLLRKLNEGGYTLVPACLRSWVFDNGKVIPGLVRRRNAEAILWGM